MSDSYNQFDWASAALSVELCDSTKLSSLVEAASLDPMADDLIDVDLSGMDLRHQDMSGWNLSHASFDNTRLSGANLRGAKINTESLINSPDWYKADIDSDEKINAALAAVRKLPVNLLHLSASTAHLLVDLGVATVDDLMGINEATLASSVLCEPKNILELKEVMNPLRVKLLEPPRLKKEIEDDLGEQSHEWYFVKSSGDDRMVEEIMDHINYLNRPTNRRVFLSRSTKMRGA